jgi:adenine-specific DNA-methyltransferase
MDERRELGQFFTPPEVAAFMAGLALPVGTEVRILEPGAGTAILTASLCERLAGRATTVHIDVYELHPRLAAVCEQVLTHCAAWLADHDIACTFVVHRGDFVLENASYLQPSLFNEPRQRYDIAIANPPYFKLLKDDRRARAAAHIVYGQPNIYAIFMAIMAGLLRKDGVMVTITPRSFTTGEYFRRFREVLFANVLPEAIHLFGSRTDAFRKDEVLQENVIMRGRRTRVESPVTITTSAGARDLDHCISRSVPLRDVVDLRSRDLGVHIPTTDVDDRVLTFIRSWPETLHTLGLSVSTGPVVAFRATAFLREAPNGGKEAALLWLQHVKKMDVRWPLDASNKRQYITDSTDSKYLLLPNATYVVMRRFSAKEEHRRIVAAPLFEGQLPGSMIGLENHLNYVHRPKGKMTHAEALGLAALLNSAIIDRFFRISNGNTQVSAVELRNLPLPPAGTIKAIGRRIEREGSDQLDRVVADALEVPADLTEELAALTCPELKFVTSSAPPVGPPTTPIHRQIAGLVVRGSGDAVRCPADGRGPGSRPHSRRPWRSPSAPWTLATTFPSSPRLVPGRHT